MDITMKLAGKRRFETEIRGLKIAFDTREANKGDNTAPEPPETFAAAVAACVGIYAAGYMDKMKLPAEGLHVEAHAEMVEDPRRVGVMKMTVHMPAALSPKQRDELLNTVKRCPLFNTLVMPPEISVEIAGME